MHDSLQVIMDAGKRGELQNVAVQVRAYDGFCCRLVLRSHDVLRCSDARATRVYAPHRVCWCPVWSLGRCSSPGLVRVLFHLAATG